MDREVELLGSRPLRVFRSLGWVRESLVAAPLWLSLRVETVPLPGVLRELLVRGLSTVLMVEVVPLVRPPVRPLEGTLLTRLSFRVVLRGAVPLVLPERRGP